MPVGSHPSGSSPGTVVHRIVRFAGLPALCLAVGCGSDRWEAAQPDVVPASGTVTFKGQPVSGAIVVFSPKEEDGSAASGLTDSAGHFTLSAFRSGEGGVPGQYRVAISKGDPSGTAIPDKYADDSKSHLMAEIPAAGKKDFVFDLKE